MYLRILFQISNFVTNIKIQDSQKEVEGRVMFVTDQPYSEVNSEQLQKPTTAEKKASQFRVQIRRSQIQKMFRSTREQQIKWLRSLNFLQEVYADLDNISNSIKDKICQLVEGLETGQQNVNFYQSIGRMQLETFLCQLSVSDEITNEHRAMVLYSLIQLTYFCSNSLRVILKQTQYIDTLATRLSKLTPHQILIFQRIIELFVNLSSQYDKEVNYFLMESDFFKKIQFYLSRLKNTEVQTSDIESIRINILNIYSNLFNYRTAEEKQLIIKLVYMLVNDVENHKYVHKMLKCLRNLSRIPQIWVEITENHYILYGQITQTVEGFIICLPSQNDDCFETYVQFLNQFVINRGQNNRDMNQLVQMNEWIYFMKKFMELYEQKTPKHKKILLKCIQFMSRILEPNFIPIHSELFKVLLDPELIKHPHYGRYCLRLLLTLLNWSGSYFQSMMEYNIFDVLYEVLNETNYYSNAPDAINLLQKIIDIKLDPKYNEDRVNILKVVQSRGYVKLIEVLLQCQDQEASTQAVYFMEWLDKVDA